MKNVLKLILLLLPFSSMAQYLEVGAFGGIASYGGDLADQRFVYQDVTEHYGGFVKYNINRFWGIKGVLIQGHLQGNDKYTSSNAKHYQYKLERNLSFRTDFTELGGMVEFNFWGYEPSGIKRAFSSYGFAGLSVFRFNPKAEYNGEWIALQPLGTEGQGIAGYQSRYSLVSAAIPFGIGTKIALNRWWNVALEVSTRKTFTDYLDDVGDVYVTRTELISGNGELAANLANRTGEYLGTDPVIVPTGRQRGNIRVSDWYSLISINISYNFMNNNGLGGKRRGGFGKKYKKCPNNF